MTEDEKRIVQALPLFRGVPEAAVDGLLGSKGCVCSDYARGEIVCDHEHFAKTLAVLLKGSVEVSKQSADGGRLIMSSMFAPVLFGAAALYDDDGRYPSILTAREDSRALFFPRSKLIAAMEGCPRLSQNYIRYLSGRIEFLNRRIFCLTAGTAEQKLAFFLLDNLPQDVPAPLPASMTDTARALNIGRASLYRAMDALEAAGAIKRDGSRITIKSKEILRGV